MDIIHAGVLLILIDVKESFHGLPTLRCLSALCCLIITLIVTFSTCVHIV